MQILTETRVESVKRTGIAITNNIGRSSEINCDTVVLALEREPRRNTIEALQGLAPDIRTIGDGNNQRGTLYSAVAGGFAAGMSL